MKDVLLQSKLEVRHMHRFDPKSGLVLEEELDARQQALLD
jgi:hypothetical protein